MKTASRKGMSIKKRTRPYLKVQKGYIYYYLKAFIPPPQKKVLKLLKIKIRTYDKNNHISNFKIAPLLVIGKWLFFNTQQPAWTCWVPVMVHAMQIGCETPSPMPVQGLVAHRQSKRLTAYVKGHDTERGSNHWEECAGRCICGSESEG